MQIIFIVHTTPEDYARQGKNYPFPSAPKRCPHTDCKMPIPMKSHGFYTRNYIKAGFNGRILIKRYICPCCGKTVSFLPYFCIPYFQYSAELIVKYISGILKCSSTLNSFIKAMKSKYEDILIERQHVYFYVRRFIENLTHICTGIRQMDTGVFLFNQDDSEKKRADRLLDIIQEGFPSIHTFSQRFFEACQKSFMAPCKLF